MSFKAIAWSIDQPIKSSYQKFLLMALANFANEDRITYPGIPRLCQITSQNRKTVMSGLAKLEELGFIKDTGDRVGQTGSVKVYQLCDKKEAVDDLGQLDKQSQNTPEAVPDPAVSSTESGKSPTPPIKKEPIVTSKGTISTRTKSVKITLAEWEVKMGAQLNAHMMKSWLMSNQIGSVVATELITDFRERVGASGTLFVDFTLAFQNWLRRGYLVLTLEGARQKTRTTMKESANVETYNRGLSL